MPLNDLPLVDLPGYRSDVVDPADFDEFWSTTLAESAEYPVAAAFTRVDNGLATIESYDVEFAGFGGEPVHGWLHLPVGLPRPLPAVVQYNGYGGGRGLPHDRVLWASAGYAQLWMDTRGQGTGTTPGDTADRHGSTPATPGFMTRGIRDRADYYYRRVFVDAVRAIDAIRGHDAVDASRVAVTGGSQGGGISLAVAGLRRDLQAVLPDVPFLCDFPRAVRIVDTDPYSEIARYLASQRTAVAEVFSTLAYFDGVNFARRATAPALFSVGLMDTVCPPSTVYAAYNAYAGEKELAVYEFNDHEGGGAFHEREQLRFLATALRR